MVGGGTSAVQRERLKGGMRRGLSGSVTSGAHRGGAGEVGWNKCYRGARDCVFPMVHYPFTTTTTPHPNPTEPPLSKKERTGSVSLHRAGVFSVN